MNVLSAIADQRLAAGVVDIARAIADRGGTALVVGGAVRDAMLGLDVADVDLEVYGLEPDVVRDTVGSRFRLNLVGEAFAVLKVMGVAIDVALPRRESKTGVGHTGFTVLSDPYMDPAVAASRRDFTINAMSADPLTGEVFDHFGGVADLEARVLRHVSDAFDEDPLRVMRGMQFAARFNATMAPETIAKCQTLDTEGLAAERMFTEWRKLILHGQRLSLGLEVLEQTGWLRFFPELDALRGVEQDPVHHPEGDVWVHTLAVMDAFAAERIGDADEDEVVGFAALCHDLGKPATTEYVDGRWRAHSHDTAGVEPARNLLRGLKAPNQLVDDVAVLVQHHLAPAALYSQGAKRPAVRRLAAKVGRIDRLVRVARADAFGRPPLPVGDFPAGDWLLDLASDLDVVATQPVPLVHGRDLIEHLGLEPGPEFKPLLDACFEAQLDGEITSLEEGLDLARRLLAS